MFNVDKSLIKTKDTIQQILSTAGKRVSQSNPYMQQKLHSKKKLSITLKYFKDIRNE